MTGASPSESSREQRVDLIEAVGGASAGAAGEGAHFEVLLHAHLGEQLAPFRHQHKAARGLGMGRQRGHILAGEPYASLERRDAAHDGAQRGGLAGAIGADQRGDRAGGGRKRDAPQDLNFAVAGLERFHPQERLAHDGTAAVADVGMSLGSPR
jgi:hypothetical protein